MAHLVRASAHDGARGHIGELGAGPDQLGRYDGYCTRIPFRSGCGAVVFGLGTAGGRVVLLGLVVVGLLVQRNLPTANCLDMKVALSFERTRCRD